MIRPKSFCLLVILLAFASAGWAQDALASGDRIRVWVKGEPELTVERTIGADGTISYPLLGNVEVAGMKSFEVARTIAKMLDDGFLREPLVQVNLVGRGSGAAGGGRSPADHPANSEVDAVTAEPLTTDAAEPSPRTPARLPIPCPVEIIDSRTGTGIGGVAMLLGGKIYQSNRLGQVVLDRTEGRVILLADGYNLVQGPLEGFVRVGPPHRIIMDPVALAEEVTVKVIDMATHLPLADVEVSLDQMKVKTNSKGIFKVREIKKEFAEIRLSRRGYRTTSKILDFKDPLEQIIPMARNE